MLYSKLGMKRSVLISLILMGGRNFTFALLAQVGHSNLGLAGAIGFENFASGIGGVCVVAYFSALCDLRFTASQYALISAAASIVGRLLTGTTAGALVEGMGYVNFYLLTTVAALPGILLFWWMMRAGLVDSSIGTAGVEGPGDARDDIRRRQGRRRGVDPVRPGHRHSGRADRRRHPQRQEQHLDHGADVSAGGEHHRLSRRRNPAALPKPPPCPRGQGAGDRQDRPRARVGRRARSARYRRHRCEQDAGGGRTDRAGTARRGAHAVSRRHRRSAARHAQWRAIARSLFLNDKSDEALVVLDAMAAPKTQGDRDRIALLRARILEELGRSDEALALFADVSTRLPGDDARCRHAGLLLKLGRERDARIVLEEVEARARRLTRQQRAGEAPMYDWAATELARIRAYSGSDPLASSATPAR